MAATTSMESSSSSSSMETATGETAAAVKAAKTRLSTGRVASRDPSMSKPTEACPKTDAWTIQEQPRIGVPTREHCQRISVSEPGIIFRNIDDVRSRGLDHDGLPLGLHLLLRIVFQIAGLFRASAHGLDRLRN